MKNLLKSLARLACLLIAGGVMAAASAAPVQVSIDTSALGVTEGFLELQLSATSGVSLVTAEVTGFVGFTLGSLQVADSWGYTSIAGGHLLRNDTPNDVLHAVHFGSVLSFLLDLDGTADAGYVTHFTASLWDASFNPLGNASALNNSVLDMAWLPQASGGGAASAVYQSSEVSLSAPSAAAALPEPSTAWLVLPALAVLCGTRRRRM